ncbi:MAG: DUF4012 domain-containing protein [Microgenomates group bacterium]
MKKPKFIFILIILILLGYFLVYRPIIKIKGKARIVIASAKELKQAFSANDIDLLNKKIDEFVNKYNDFKKEAKTVYWASFIPYVADFKNGVEAGEFLLEAAQKTAKAIEPYADLIGFKKGTASFVERSAEERLQTAVLTLDKVLSKIDQISADIEKAQVRMDKINPKRYPKKIGRIVVREKIENIKEQVLSLTSLFVDAKPLVKKLPEILGKDKEKTYLILFQNDKELRATGGFLTSYAIFKVKDGKIRIVTSEDIYSLDESISTHPPAPREIATYHKGVYTLNLRDSNLSPDFPTSIELFNSLYKKSSKRVNYDGIIAVDSKVLVDMLTIFGDTEADGIVFSAKKDPRCDCPQVLYRLFDIVDRPTPYIRENRKGILGDLMYVLFYKALGFSPSKYWGTLAQQMFQNLKEKHILLYFVDSDIQQAVEKLNFAGRIRDYQGDFLHINNVNFAGAKSNMFVSETIISKTKTNDNGKISRQVTVEYRNPYPHSDCNLERGGLCLNATLRNWIRVYVPKGSTLVEFKGSLKKVVTFDDLGKTVFEGYLEVPTQGKAKVDITYILPSTVQAKNYRLLIQKQPGTSNQKLKIEIDGKKIYDDIFNFDQEFKRE